MSADTKFTVKNAINEQALVPVTVSEDIEQKFIRKAKSSSIKLIPISIIVAAVVGTIIFLLVYFLHRIAISLAAIFCVFFPIYAVYDAFATAKALKNHDYEFLYGDVVGKSDNGSYKIRGLEELNANILFGKKEYNPGEKAIVARVKDDLYLISED